MFRVRRRADVRRRMRPIVLAVLFGVSAGHLPAMAHARAAGEAGAKTAAVTAPAQPLAFWNCPVNDPVPHTIRGAKLIQAHALAPPLKSKTRLVVDVSNAPPQP